MAALDLGGGSTQVTFAALAPSSLKETQYIHKAAVPQGSLPVYTHSYLGLGLMAVRKEIITLNQGNKTTVISECVNPIIKSQKFHYGGKDYFVSGLQSGYPTSKIIGNDIILGEEVPIVNFEKCSGYIRNYVKNKANPPQELTTKQIFAFSYYFDRASDVGLIG